MGLYIDGSTYIVSNDYNEIDFEATIEIMRVEADIFPRDLPLFQPRLSGKSKRAIFPPGYAQPSCLSSSFSILFG